MSTWIPPGPCRDIDDIAKLNDAAFGQSAEGKIVRKLKRDGDSVLSMIAHDDSQIVGHRAVLLPSRLTAHPRPWAWAMSVCRAAKGRASAAGWCATGLLALEGAGESLVLFVLGARGLLSARFGFSADTAAPFDAPWSGPQFHGEAAGDSAPVAGNLTYPACSIRV